MIAFSLLVQSFRQAKLVPSPCLFTVAVRLCDEQHLVGLSSSQALIALMDSTQLLLDSSTR